MHHIKNKSVGRWYVIKILQFHQILEPFREVHNQFFVWLQLSN